MQAQLHGWAGGQIANREIERVTAERILGAFRLMIGLQISPPASAPDEGPAPMVLIDGELLVKDRPVGHLRLLIATQLQWQLPPPTSLEAPLLESLADVQPTATPATFLAKRPVPGMTPDQRQMLRPRSFEFERSAD